MVVVGPGTLLLTLNSKLNLRIAIRRRSTSCSFHNKYRPQFYLRTTDVTGEIELPAGRDMVMPGDNVPITVLN